MCVSVSASEPEYVSVSVAKTKRDPFDRVKPSWCHYSSDKHFLSLNLSFHNRTTQQRQIYKSIPKTHPVEIGVEVNKFPGAFGLFLQQSFLGIFASPSMCPIYWEGQTNI